MSSGLERFLFTRFSSLWTCFVNQRLCVEQVGLRKSVADQPPSLAMQRSISETENPNRFLAHGFVHYGLHVLRLLAENLLYGLHVRKGDLLWADTDGRAVQFMFFMKGQSSVTGKINRQEPPGGAFCEQRSRDMT